MKFEVDGIDEVIKELENYSEAVSRAVNDARGEYSLEEILNEEFMQENTRFSSLQKFLDASGIQDVENKVDSPEFTQFVNDNTPFASVDEMWETACKDFLAKKIDKI